MFNIIFANDNYPLELKSLTIVRDFFADTEEKMRPFGRSLYF